MKTICQYCTTENTAPDRCVACGAPLPARQAPPPPAVKPVTPATEFIPPPSPEPFLSPQAGEQLRQGAAVLGTGLGALGIGSFFLRIAASAVAIAVAAYITGSNAGAASGGSPYPLAFLAMAMLGGALIGLAVGYARKNALFTLLSAPAGAFLGNYLAFFLELNGYGTPWMALFSAIGAIVLALIGHRPGGTLRIRWLQRIRPLLGLLGGVLFGLIGFTLGANS